MSQHFSMNALNCYYVSQKKMLSWLGIVRSGLLDNHEPNYSMYRRWRMHTFWNKSILLTPPHTSPKKDTLGLQTLLLFFFKKYPNSIEKEQTCRYWATPLHSLFPSWKSNTTNITSKTHKWIHSVMVIGTVIALCMHTFIFYNLKLKLRFGSMVAAELFSK